jgi:hypothetical protein
MKEPSWMALLIYAHGFNAIRSDEPGTNQIGLQTIRRVQWAAQGGVPDFPISRARFHPE